MLGKIGSAFLLVCAMATAVAVAPVANAQASVAPDATPTAKPITFEVASVRLNKTGAHGGMARPRTATTRRTCR